MAICSPLSVAGRECVHQQLCLAFCPRRIGPLQMYFCLLLYLESFIGIRNSGTISCLGRAEDLRERVPLNFPAFCPPPPVLFTATSPNSQTAPLTLAPPHSWMTPGCLSKVLGDGLPSLPSCPAPAPLSGLYPFLRDFIGSNHGTFLFFFFCLLRAVPAAYGDSQGRVQNRRCSCQPPPQPQQCQI